MVKQKFNICSEGHLSHQMTAYIIYTHKNLTITCLLASLFTSCVNFAIPMMAQVTNILTSCNKLDRNISLVTKSLSLSLLRYNSVLRRCQQDDNTRL